MEKEPENSQTAKEHIKQWPASLVTKEKKIKISSMSPLDKEDRVLPGSDVLALWWYRLTVRLLEGHGEHRGTW